MATGTLTRYAVYSDGHGFITFGSYGVHGATLEPDPRDLYRRPQDARRRITGNGAHAAERYPNARVVKVELTWEMVEST